MSGPPLTLGAADVVSKPGSARSAAEVAARSRIATAMTHAASEAPAAVA